MRRKRRLTPKGRLALGAVILILLCMLLSLLFSPETQHKTAPPSKPSEIEFIISERTQSADDISVWLGGEIVSMPLEEYLVGVVAAEMPAAFLPEALKAQAVAARTYTMYKASHGGCSAHAGAEYLHGQHPLPGIPGATAHGETLGK